MDAYLLRGLTHLAAERPRAALKDFLAAGEYPENLSVGRPENDARAPQVACYMARAHEALGNAEEARVYDEKSAQQKGTDGWPETRFYQARSMAQLGQVDQAKAVYEELVRTAKSQIEHGGDTDVFAKFGEQQARQTRLATAHYLQGLGYLGLGRMDAARAEFEQAIRLNASHVWARVYVHCPGL